MKRSADLELIERARQGDSLAFRDLVDIHHRFAINLAFRFTGDRMEAEDIAQEVFVKVWKNLGGYRPEVKFTTWLYRMVTNQALDYLKSASRKHRLRHTDIEHQSVPEVTEDREWLELIAKLAHQLPEKQQAVFVLRDLQGLSGEEAAEVLNLSPDTVKSNLYHARLSMRELLMRQKNEMIAP